MTKQIILFLCIFFLTGCDKPTDCTPETAAKMLLYRWGQYADMNNPATVRFYTKGLISKKTGYNSTYYGTPICKMYDSETGFSTCYMYVPQTGGYEYFMNSEIGCN